MLDRLARREQPGLHAQVAYGELKPALVRGIRDPPRRARPDLRRALAPRCCASCSTASSATSPSSARYGGDHGGAPDDLGALEIRLKARRASCSCCRRSRSRPATTSSRSPPTATRTCRRALRQRRREPRPDRARGAAALLPRADGRRAVRGRADGAQLARAPGDAVGLPRRHGAPDLGRDAPRARARGR